MKMNLCSRDKSARCLKKKTDLPTMAQKVNFSLSYSIAALSDNTVVYRGISVVSECFFRSSDGKCAFLSNLIYLPIKKEGR